MTFTVDMRDELKDEDMQRDTGKTCKNWWPLILDVLNDLKS